MRREGSGAKDEDERKLSKYLRRCSRRRGGWPRVLLSARCEVADLCGLGVVLFLDRRQQGKRKKISSVKRFLEMKDMKTKEKKRRHKSFRCPGGWGNEVC